MILFQVRSTTFQGLVQGETVHLFRKPLYRSLGLMTPHFFLRGALKVATWCLHTECELVFNLNENVTIDRYYIFFILLRWTLFWFKKHLLIKANRLTGVFWLYIWWQPTSLEEVGLKIILENTKAFARTNRIGYCHQDTIDCGLLLRGEEESGQEGAEIWNRKVPILWLSCRQEWEIEINL